jgi:hypothetical protein
MRKRRGWTPPGRTARAVRKVIPKQSPLYRPALRSYEWWRKKWFVLRDKTLYRS